MYEVVEVEVNWVVWFIRGIWGQSSSHVNIIQRFPVVVGVPLEKIVLKLKSFIL